MYPGQPFPSLRPHFPATDLSPARPPNMDQLANKKDRRLAGFDDVSLGSMCVPIGPSKRRTCYLWPLSLTRFAGGLPFGVYAIAQNFNIPLQVQPQIFMALCLVSWAQILLYHRYGTFWGSHPRGQSLMLHDSNWPAWKASLLGLAVAIVFAGVEAALILTLKVGCTWLPKRPAHEFNPVSRYTTEATRSRSW